MRPIRLKYVHEYRDRHGHLRRYFRRGSFQKIMLPGATDSAEFLTAYNAALAACTVEPARPTTGAGTISATIASYYGDNAFLTLAPGTQKMRRAILERFRSQCGHLPLAQMRQRDVAALLGRQKPWAARNWLKTLRGLMAFAVENEIRPDDPTAGVKPAKAKAGTIHTWSDDEITQFEAHHPIGSMPRLAMALLLFTAQRRSDVIRMGPQHVHGGLLQVVQQKTRRRLEIPLHPTLIAVLAATPTNHLTYLTTPGGAPFTAAGFGNAFRDWCNAAGLPQCSSHGLRKAQCRLLAEAGCTAPQIAAISGHKSLSEVQRYIEAAEQVKLAKAAMATITPTALRTKRGE
jgi:integrase